MDYKGMTKSRKKYIENMTTQISKSKWISSIKELISKEKYSKALSELEKYLEKYPDDSYGLFQLGCVYEEIGEKELAKDKFQYIIDNKMDSIHSSMFKLGMMAYKAGDFAKAIKLFKDNIETSDYPEVYSIIQLSNIYLQQGEKKKALDTIYRYGNMNDEDILVQYAIILNSLEKRDDAYETLIMHTFDEKNYQKYYYAKASIEVNIDLFEEALKTLEDHKQYLKMDDKTDYIKGIAFYRLGRYEEAIDTFNSIIESCSADFSERAYYMLGEIFIKQQKHEEALKSYLKMVEHQTAPIYKGYYNAAEVYSLIGDKEHAKEYYHKCIDNSINKQLISSSYLRLGFFDYREGNADGVRENLSNVNPDILDETEISSYSFLKAYTDRLDGIIHKYPTYLYQQVFDYSLERLAEHIDKNHGYFGKTSRFNEDIDPSELVLQIPELLDKGVLHKNADFDRYIVKYDGIGRIGEKITDWLEIVVIPNTRNVLTMYPVSDKIEDSKQEKKSDNSKSKEKVLSRIEKFNQKYGIKSE